MAPTTLLGNGEKTMTAKRLGIPVHFMESGKTIIPTPSPRVIEVYPVNGRAYPFSELRELLERFYEFADARLAPPIEEFLKSEGIE